jgi:hypothetical protein
MNCLRWLDGLRATQRVTAGCAHFVHADRCDGLHARVDLGRTDDEAAAAADAESANPAPVHEGLGAQEIHCGAEVLGIDVWRHGIAGLALALTPER